MALPHENHTRTAPARPPVNRGHRETPTPVVVALDHPQATDFRLVGGKGANLARLRQRGFAVPDGFCVTTEACALLVTEDRVHDLVEQLSRTDPEDTDTLTRLAGAVRHEIGRRSLPPPVRNALARALERTGRDRAYAVRSSATAEDLPHASFAGQYETVLNVRGEERIAEAVLTCIAGLFSDRAVRYRARQGIRPDEVAMAVVVQRMVESEAAGGAFSADPTTGHRHVAVIEAVFGLGEGQVSGRVEPDRIRVDRRHRRILDHTMANKSVAVETRPEGGVATTPLTGNRRRARVLSDAQALALTDVVGDVERTLGGPQDVEWAIRDGTFLILQSRPITTLFPLPAPPPTDGAPHVYYSFGHKQAMPEAMPQLVLDLWRHMASPVGTMVEAGGRLYLDITPFLTRPLARRWVLRGFRWSDSLAETELSALLQRNDLQHGPRLRWHDVAVVGVTPRNLIGVGRALLLDTTNGVAVRERTWYDRYADAAVARIRSRADVLDRVHRLLAETRRVAEDLVNRCYPFLLAAVLAEAWLKRLCPGREVEIDAVARGLELDVITAMNLDLGEVADVARAHPQVMEALAQGRDPTEIRTIEGGADFTAALEGFLDRYGFRGPAEIDLSRPRWREDPTPLLRAIRGNLLGGARGEQRAHVDRLVEQARTAADRLQEHAVRGRVGRRLVGRLIEVVRAYLPIREMPKFALARILAEARGVLLDAGAALVRSGRLDTAEDVWFLRLEELLTSLNDPTIPLGVDVAERRVAFARYTGLRAPRVMTGDGETGTGAAVPKDVPTGALVGLPVSGGSAEGRARIVLDAGRAVLRKGEILVSRYCDPGWTPLFLNAAAMVTEVGGQMTHGSLVAREYGIPAVVSVDDATTRIRTGQRIRVDGDRGIVELLDRDPDR